MKHEQSCELTNMVMIHDKSTNNVLVIDRVRRFKGFSFPGGHVEPAESFIDSAIREIKEETGFTIKNLKACGVFHWYDPETKIRSIEFLYKTSDYTGTMLTETNEGKISWINLDELVKLPSTNNFDKYLPMFINDYTEAFGIWNDDYTNITDILYI